jgi:1-acyl-sn-glycerol-3-phosphate acyltransferase
MAELVAVRKAARAVAAVRRRGGRVRTLVGRAGFPYRAASQPKGVARLPVKRTTGTDFDTDWARSPVARAARAAVVELPMRGVVRAAADPEVAGLDRLADRRRAGSHASPVIFVANHESHLDTPLLLTCIPEPWRHRLVVAAAADYFFGSRLTGSASALVLNAIPIERTTINRRSADHAAALIDDGWSLLIFPEGGRSPDGWAQPFKGGAAYLAHRCRVPVVPIHVDGSGAIFGKGAKRLKPGRTRITFGAPLVMSDDENVRRFGDRIEQVVATLGDEALTDWWSARRRAAAGTTPTLGGPAFRSWRRAWALSDQRARGKAGQRRRQKRGWPVLD